MTAQEYIMSTLEELSKPVVLEIVDSKNLEDAIYSKVMSKKFRKLKAGDEAVQRTRAAIKLAVKEDKPITICQIFGGNKLWRFEEAPEIDWAELFSLIYFMKWTRLITTVYKPGVHYEYYSQDISVESLNNVPRSETDQYSKTFRDMLAWVKPYLPNNVKVTYHRHYEDFTDPKDYDREITAAKQRVLKENHGQLPVLDQNMQTATELNVQLRPGQTDDPQWREKVELEHQAIFKTPTLRQHLDDPHLIYTCPTFYGDSVVTGSTKKSYAKFWAGVGALERTENGFDELVLTPKQLETAQFKWEDVRIEGLKGKNFSRVRIL